MGRLHRYWNRSTELVPHTVGGAIAQVVAARCPERLGRLVLTGCEAFGIFPPTPFAALLAAARSDLVRRLMSTMRPPGAAGSHRYSRTWVIRYQPRLTAELIRQFVRDTPPAPVGG